MAVFKFILIVFFWPLHVAHRILAPQPGVRPAPSAVEVWSLNHRTTTQVPEISLISHFCDQVHGCSKLS